MNFRCSVLLLQWFRLLLHFFYGWWRYFMFSHKGEEKWLMSSTSDQELISVVPVVASKENRKKRD